MRPSDKRLLGLENFQWIYITYSDMSKHIVKNCRELINLVSTVVSRHFPPFLGILTLFSFLPAFLYGCDVPQASSHSSDGRVTKISMNAVTGQIGEMDVFVFRNDRMQKLDCYQKVKFPSLWNNEIISGTGERLIAVCANSGKEVMDWTSITSLPYLRNLSFRLENESIIFPFMSGIAEISTGKDNRYKTLNLRPLLSIVMLRSISCDFTGRPYAGEVLKDIKVYLTNVSAECGILEDSDLRPTRIINTGRLCEDDMLVFEDPGLIAREIEGEIGKTVMYPDIQLICYPNNSITEGPGTPFTRLVIEGRIDGELFYWPININQENGGHGIGRNEKYIFDITITRKGTKNPDTPVKREDIDLIFNIETWNEKVDCEIIF